MHIVRGRILVQRFFDIAEDIDLSAAVHNLGDLARRPRIAGGARHITLPTPPVQVALGPTSLGVAGLEVTDTWARIYDFGLLALTFAVALPPGTDSESLVALSAELCAEEARITEVATPLARQIREALAPASHGGTEATFLHEDYTVFALQELSAPMDASLFTEAIDIPRVLLGEQEGIAQGVRDQCMQAAFSYRPDDLVVIDWNSAVVFDPRGAIDVAELLELACVQMLELRAYDRRVGRALDGLYVELDARHYGFFRSARFSRLSRRIMKLYVDIVEITERIDNSLNLLSDTWLARVHGAAVVEFGIPHWQRQLRSKLEVLRQINQLLVDQITAQKSFGIEAAIVILIMVEVAMAAMQLR